MFNTFGKLLCAAVLASTALAQSVTIVSPPAGAQVNAAESVVVMLEETVRVTHLGAVHGSSPSHHSERRPDSLYSHQPTVSSKLSS